MSNACCGGSCHFDGAFAAYRKVLWAVIVMNAGMFAVEVAAGQLAGSQALLADSLDFLADAATYAASLWAIGRALRVRAQVALLKGASLAMLSLVVLGTTLWRVIDGAAPEPLPMGVVGALALAVNIAAALLLFRFRDGDANVRSVWLCSRNDAVGNVAVVLAGLGVYVSGSPWPDLAVAIAIAALFLHSASLIVRQALGELRSTRRSGTAIAPAE